eukprot:7522015-Prorocentrum_lima.AAC.1
MSGRTPDASAYTVEIQLQSGQPSFQPINQEGGIESWVCQEHEILYGLQPGLLAGIAGILRGQTHLGYDLT